MRTKTLMSKLLSNSNSKCKRTGKRESPNPDNLQKGQDSSEMTYQIRFKAKLTSLMLIRTLKIWNPSTGQLVREILGSLPSREPMIQPNLELELQNLSN